MTTFKLKYRALEIGMPLKSTFLVGVFCAITHSAFAQTIDLAALQAAIREMCVQPDRKASILQIEGDLNVGAKLKIVGVGGQEKLRRLIGMG